MFKLSSFTNTYCSIWENNAVLFRRCTFYISFFTQIGVRTPSLGTEFVAAEKWQKLAICRVPADTPDRAVN